MRVKKSFLLRFFHPALRGKPRVTRGKLSACHAFKHGLPRFGMAFVPFCAITTLDLHTHSTFSDGSLTPEQLVNEAKKTGLSAIALTDHDSVTGVPRFLAASRENAIRGITGVEISLDFRGSGMHMLGYFIDCQNPDLTLHLADISAGRVSRNKNLLKQLNNMGLILTMSEVESFAGENNIGRLHFAQALIMRGYVKNKEEAFNRFLAKGKSAYVNRLRLSPAQGIRMILNAGGIAVLAHPFTLDLSKQAMESLISELSKEGLDGLEIYYPQHTTKQIALYNSIAEQCDLVATGGTDFHGAQMPNIKIGRGFGAMNIPDTILEKLDERRKQRKR